MSRAADQPKTGMGADTVLIVADSWAARSQYRDALLAAENCPYTLLESTSAVAALTLCAAHTIAGIVVSDELPDGSGLEFVQWLQQRFAGLHPPVVIVAPESEPPVSPREMVQRAVYAMRGGAADFLLQQDLTAAQLRDSVQQSIAQHRAQLEREQQRDQAVSDRVAELQTLIEIAPVGIAIASHPSCRQMHCNAQMRQMLGVNLGHNISKSAPVEEQPTFRVFQQGQEVSAENLPMQVAARLGIEVRDIEIEIRLVDGTRRQLLSYATPICGGPDEVRGVVGAFLEITERNQMEVELRQREAIICQQLAELEGIYATAPVGLAFHDTHSRFVRINDRMAEINGFPAAEHLGRTLRDVLPTLADMIEPLHRQVIETGEPILNIEIHGTTKADPLLERDWIASYYPLKDSAGRVLGVNVVVQDVSEAKQAQAEREQLLRQLEIERSFLGQTLQQMPSGVAIAEVPSGQLLFHNDEAIRLLRHPMKSGSSYEAYVEYGALHPDQRPYAPEEYPIARSVLTGAVVKAEEMKYRRGDGTETVLSVNAAPIVDQSGQRIAAVSTFEDISERKQVERERLLLAQIVESSSDAIIGVTLDRQIMSWNRGAERMFGYTAAEVIGQSLDVLLANQSGDESELGIDMTSEGQGVTQFEATRWRKDGRLVEVSITVSPIKNASSELIGLSEVFRDITVRKHLEREREHLLAQAEAARAEAEVANRSKDEFVAMVAHELRSPLNAIMGWAKLLQTRNFDPSTTQKALETIVRNTQSQVQLVEDLLDVSRMVRGTLPLTMTPINLVEAITGAVETVRPTAAAKGQQLKMQLPDRVPVLGDLHRLQQVVLNLLTNAIKFTPEGGRIEVDVAVSNGSASWLQQVPGPDSVAHQADGYVQVQIKDTGKGIAPDFLPYIFDRFRQDQDNNTARQGLGLGLAIVKYLVEMHSGSVTVESPGEGEGVTFTVLLPLLAQHAVTPSEPVLPAHDLAATQPLADIRVLLVDDEPDILSLLAFILQEYGATVQTATNVSSAFAQLPQFQPHILLSDIAMPQQDGYELLRQLRSHPLGQIPAIALTAYASETCREESLQAGFQQHLTKPVEPDQLVTEILSILEHQRA